MNYTCKSIKRKTY